MFRTSYAENKRDIESVTFRKNKKNCEIRTFFRSVLLLYGFERNDDDKSKYFQINSNGSTLVIVETPRKMENGFSAEKIRGTAVRPLVRRMSVPHTRGNRKTSALP